jgi:hypothetical protein
MLARLFGQRYDATERMDDSAFLPGRGQTHTPVLSIACIRTALTGSLKK